MDDEPGVGSGGDWMVRCVVRTPLRANRSNSSSNEPKNPTTSSIEKTTFNSSGKPLSMTKSSAAIRTFAGSKGRPTWVFAAIKVWSRHWPTTIVGRRSRQNTLALIRDVSSRIDFAKLPLIVTDGFDFYEKGVTESVESLARRLSNAQVLKTRRNDRIVKVERRALTGAAWRFEEALSEQLTSTFKRLWRPDPHLIAEAPY